MRNKKTLVLYVFLVMLLFSGCNKKKSVAYTNDGVTSEDVISEETTSQTLKDPFAFDDKVQGFYHTKNMEETSRKEYSNTKEVLREFGLETVIDAPVYEYYDEDGDVCLSLYYDEKQEVGMVWFDPAVDIVNDARCYVFYGSEIDQYTNPKDFLPYETDSSTGDYLEPILVEYNVSSYHSNSASPTYLSITEKNDSSKEVAHIDYFYYSEIESELKCVKFNGQQDVFGNIASEFEIWYENNGSTLHDGIVIGDIKYRMYNIDTDNQYEFYGKVGEKNISIIIRDDKVFVAGL